MTRLALAAALLATVVSLGACHPTLTAESPAPPGRAARLDPISGFWGVKRYRLALSAGVAFAVSCTYGGPCEQLTATSDDRTIATVHAAAFSALRAVGFSSAQQPLAAVVIVGKAPGTTTIRLRSRAGDREVQVTVVPPPIATR